MQKITNLGITKLTMLCLLTQAMLVSNIVSQDNAQSTRATCPQTCNTCDFLTVTLDAIESILEQPAEVSPCAATPITPANFMDLTQTYTITAPGTYCLTNNIEGLIIIDSSDVTLDLNSFNLENFSNPGSNISCTNHNNITIKNGSLSGGFFGITITSCNGVQLLDLVLTRLNIVINKSNYILLDNVTVTGATQDGCDINTCQYVQIVDSVFSDRNNRGLSATSSSNLLISKSIFNDNNTNGFFADGSTTNLVLSDCVASGNASSGFVISSTNFSLDLCSAMNNQNFGFFINGPIGTVTNCNAVGATSGDGFNIVGAQITVSNNQANHNAGRGFVGLNPSAHTHFYSNAACNNTSSNYFNVAEPQLQLGNPNFAAGFNLSN